MLCLIAQLNDSLLSWSVSCPHVFTCTPASVCSGRVLLHGQDDTCGLSPLVCSFPGKERSAARRCGCEGRTAERWGIATSPFLEILAHIGWVDQKHTPVRPCIGGDTVWCPVRLELVDSALQDGSQQTLQQRRACHAVQCEDTLHNQQPCLGGNRCNPSSDAVHDRAWPGGGAGGKATVNQLFLVQASPH